MQLITPGRNWQQKKPWNRLAVYIYTATESNTNVDIYFDDFDIQVEQTHIVAGNDYYPFGLPIVERSYEKQDYRYDYQSAYSEKDDETGWNSFQLRKYACPDAKQFGNARIGRWISPDPYGQFASAYVGMGNNPVSGVDPDGGWANWSGFAKGAVIGAGIGAIGGAAYALSTDEKGWGWYALGGGVAGGLAGGGIGELLDNTVKPGNTRFRTTKRNLYTDSPRLGKLKYPKYKGSLFKDFKLFDRLQFGSIGSDMLSISLSHTFSMGRIFNSFNFNFDIQAPEFNIDLFGPGGNNVFNYTNEFIFKSDGTVKYPNSNPQTGDFIRNGEYTVKTSADLMPGKGYGPGNRIVDEYGNVRLNVNTRRVSHTQYMVLKHWGWKGNVKRVKWWQFWK